MSDPADWWKDEPEQPEPFTELLRTDQLGRIDVKAFALLMERWLDMSASDGE